MVASLARFGPTALFVILWSSGGIVSRIGLEAASPFALLALRFVVASCALLAAGAIRGRILPDRGTRGRVAVAGLFLIAGYTSCYFLALGSGVTPGVLATILGLQPIFTLIALERRFHLARFGGLLLAFLGLLLIVTDGVAFSRFPPMALAFAIGALANITAGGILQKGISQPPEQVLPLQYLLALAVCLCLLPTQPIQLRFTWGVILAVGWLGIVISVVAQLLLYRLIRAGNLVNVTSLFYLVPIVTAIMDYAFLGNRLSGLSFLGMLAILGGLRLVYSSGPGQPARG